MNIDWSKAPEGYPIWIEEVGQKSCGDAWHRDDGDRYTDQDGKYWTKPEGTFYKAYRKPEESVWTGEGLPPVGTVCLFAGGHSCPSDPWDKDLHEGDKVTIIAHFLDGVMELAAFTFNASIRNRGRGAACVEQGSSGCFRPIRTTEQIAAEEREKAVGDMFEIACAPEGTSMQGVMRLLYDAGYRKVQP